MTDQELLKELITESLISSDSGARLLRDAELGKTTIEKLIYDRRLIDDVLFAKAKAKLLGVPFRKIEAEKIPVELLKLIPRETSENYKVIPIEKKGNMLVVGMLNPLDDRAQDTLRFIAKRERVSLGVFLVCMSDLREVWQRYKPYRTEIEELVASISGGKNTPTTVVALDEGARTSEDAPVIKIVAKTLQSAVEAKASDIHIEPGRENVRVRFRLDGELKEIVVLPSVLAQPVTSRIKVLANLRLDENRIPQDGRFRTLILNREIDFRVATFPVPNGEKIVLRVLDPLTGLKGLESIGFERYNFVKIQRAVAAPYGMILISGPTGSGKTTTLYAVMQKIDTNTENVVTLEDPVEYTMDGINQSQVRPEIGYSFASGLRQILRQDPDVIMVGEIRDGETAGLAVNAALTGHIVLSTIHTNNSLGIIPRMIDLGVPKFLLPSALHTLIGQRLLQHICPECRVKITPLQEVQDIITSAIKSLPAEVKTEISDLYGKGPYTTWKTEPNPTCKVCKGKGVIGRIAIAEVLQMTHELGEIISQGFSEEKVLAEAERQGMIVMRTDGIIKALRGDVLIEEVLRETE